MSENGKTPPHSRVYWHIVGDEKFEAIYEDDAALACWLRLLILHDKAWPAMPVVPYGTKPRALKKLVEAGLVDLHPHHQYAIHGLDAERTRRGARWRALAEQRWGEKPRK